jgi:hypothetical protein
LKPSEPLVFRYAPCLAGPDRSSFELFQTRF